MLIAGVALEDIELQEGGTIVEAIFAPKATAPTLRVIQGGGICCAAGVLPWAGGASPALSRAVAPAGVGATAGGIPLGACVAGNLGCGKSSGSGVEVMSGVQ